VFWLKRAVRAVGRGIRAVGRGIATAARWVGRGIKPAAKAVGKAAVTVVMVVLKAARFVFNVIGIALSAVVMVLGLVVLTVIGAIAGLFGLISWGFTALMRLISPASCWHEYKSGGFSLTELREFFTDTVSNIREDDEDEDAWSTKNTAEVQTEVPAAEETELAKDLREIAKRKDGTTVKQAFDELHGKNGHVATVTVLPVKDERLTEDERLSLKDEVVESEVIDRDPEAHQFVEELFNGEIEGVVVEKVEETVEYVDVEIDPKKPVFSQLTDVEMPSAETAERVADKQSDMMGLYFSKQPFTMQQLETIRETCGFERISVESMATYEELLDIMGDLGRQDRSAVRKALKALDRRNRSGKVVRKDKPTTIPVQYRLKPVTS
jgi:hypothetical protein